jgi:hypothetical protein
LLLPFAFKLAEWDVNACDSEHLLFRRNSLGSKLITATLKTYGQGFLKKTMQPLIAKMMETPDRSYEINPAYIKKGENLGQNRSALKHLCDFVFNSIVDSLNRVPVAVMLTCHGVARAATKAFPDSSHLAVGNCFFLRFFSPALVSPKAHGIWEDPLPANISRGLVLVSKVLQAVASSHFTGFQEDYMECMTSFVTVASTRGLDFLKRIATLPQPLDELTLAKFHSVGIILPVMPGPPRDHSVLGRRRDGCVVPGMVDRELLLINKLLHKHKDALLEHLQAAGDVTIAAKLKATLEAIGPPSDLRVHPPEIWTPRLFQPSASSVSWNSTYVVEEADATVQSEEYLDTGTRLCIRVVPWGGVLPPPFPPPV